MLTKEGTIFQLLEVREEHPYHGAQTYGAELYTDMAIVTMIELGSNSSM